MALKIGRKMKYTPQEAANIQMGQVGSAFIDDNSGTLSPPTGCVIVAIQIASSSTKLDLLTAEDNTRWIDNASAAHSSSTHPQDSDHGDGGEAYDATTVLYPGMTIYGRWTAVSTSQGSLIAYFGK